MYLRSVRHVLFIGASSLSLLTAANAAAQSALASVPTTATQGGDSAVGEIIVTASKREQRLRDVASTVNVVTGDQFAAAGPILSTGDVLAKFSGVRFNDLESPQLSEITMRGSGTQRATGADAAIGLFANGVYIGDSSGFGRNFTPLDSFDLERAEVLEGPQGALYGRNAEYGVVNLVSQRAKFANDGYADVINTFETQNTRETVVVNHIIKDDLAARVAVQGIQQSKGFIYDPDTGKYFDSTHGFMGRAQLRYTPGKWDVSLVGAVQQVYVPGYGQIVDILPNTNANYAGAGYQGNRYSVPIPGDGTAKEYVVNVLLLTNYDFGWAKLSSTTSYRDRNDIENRGFSSLPIDLATEAMLQAEGDRGLYPYGFSNIQGRTKAAYEDVHLGGAALDSRLNWLVGAEYLNALTNTSNQTASDPCNSGAPVIGVQICGGTPSQPFCVSLAPGAKACPTVFPFGFGSNTIGRKTYQSWAAYTSMTYKLPLNFSFTGDLRFNDDNKHFNQTTYSLYTTNYFTYPTGGTKTPLDFQYKKDVITYAATLAYKLPGPWDDMLYGKVGTGYRAGDFNITTSPPLVNGLLAGAAPPVGYAPATPTYGAETVTSYEIGVKGNLTRRVYFTLDAYTSRMDNALSQVTDGCSAANSCQTAATTYVRNVGASTASGVEASADTGFHLFDGAASLHLSGSNQQARYVNVPTTIVGLPLEGSQVPQTPHWLATAAVNYRRTISGALEGFANLTFNGQWGGIQDPVVASLNAVPLSDYQDVNLRMGVDFKAFEIAVVSKNLTNESHTLLTAVAAPTLGPLKGTSIGQPTAQRWNTPRTTAIELKYRW